MAAEAAPVTLVNNPICPFGARAHIALAAHLSEGEFEVKEASLADKPAWFTEIYRKAMGSDPESTGKVPVLQDGDVIIVESAIVAEYVDRKFAASPDARLLSDDPLARAEAQLFVEQFSGKVIGGFYKLLMAKAADREALTATRHADMKALNDALVAHDASTGQTGPFFEGTKFGWVEVMLYPWFARGSALRVHRGFEVEESDATPRLRAWMAACAKHPAVLANVSPDEYYSSGYKQYADRGEE